MNNFAILVQFIILSLTEMSRNMDWDIMNLGIIRQKHYLLMICDSIQDVLDYTYHKLQG